MQIRSWFVASAAAIMLGTAIVGQAWAGVPGSVAVNGSWGADSAKMTFNWKNISALDGGTITVNATACDGYDLYVTPTMRESRNSWVYGRKRHVGDCPGTVRFTDVRYSSYQALQAVGLELCRDDGVFDDTCVYAPAARNPYDQ